MAFEATSGEESELNDVSLIGRDPRLLHSHRIFPIIRREEGIVRRGPAPAMMGHRLFTRFSDGTRSAQSSFLPERSPAPQGLYWMRAPSPTAATEAQAEETPDQEVNVVNPWNPSRINRPHPPLWALLSPRRVRGRRYDLDEY